MKPCTEHQDALVELASGTLEDAKVTPLERHLAGCDGCRAELHALRQTLAAVVLPPLTARERVLATELQVRVNAALERPARASPWRWPAVAGLALAAGLATVVVAPRLSGPGGETAPEAAAELTDEEALEAWALADPLNDALPEGEDGL